MPENIPLTPAAELAAKNKLHYPNESLGSTGARARLCSLRKSSYGAILSAWLSCGVPCRRVGKSKRPTRFRGSRERRPSGICSAGSGRWWSITICLGLSGKRPCPMCTSMLSSLEGETRDIEQRVALAVIARSPIERLLAFKRERGWRDLKLYSDTTGEFSRDYHAISADGGDDANLQVFTREGTRSVISGVARWDLSRRTRDRIRVERRTSCQFGMCLTARVRDVGSTGIPSWITASPSKGSYQSAREKGLPGGRRKYDCASGRSLISL